MTKTLTSGPLSISLTPTGISLISLAGKPLTTPGPAQGLFTSPVFPSTQIGNVVNSTTQNYSSGVSLRTEYSLVGSVLGLQFTVANPTRLPLQGISIALPSFIVSGLGNNNLNGWNAGDLTQNAAVNFHPGPGSQYAATWWQAANSGIAIHCPSHFTKQTVINNSASGSANMALYVMDTVPAGGSLEISLSINIVPPGTPDANVLAAYLTDIHSLNAKVTQTTRDYRPWIQLVPASTSTTNVDDLAWVTSTNPYGLQCRLDEPQGILQLQAMIQPLVGLASGIMIWQPYWNPRGAAYRPDFDCMPPTVQAGLTTFFAWCKSVGLKAGMWVRLNQIIQPQNWTTDTVIPFNPSDVGQMAMLVQRINNLVAMGVNALGLDSVGDSLSDYTLLMNLRAAFPAMPFFIEHRTDILLSLADAYLAVNPQMDGSSVDCSALTWEVLKLVQPSVAVMAKYSGPYPTAAQSLALQFSPLIQAFQSAEELPMVQQFDAGLGTSNGWK